MEFTSPADMREMLQLLQSGGMVPRQDENLVLEDDEEDEREYVGDYDGDEAFGSPVMSHDEDDEGDEAEESVDEEIDEDGEIEEVDAEDEKQAAATTQYADVPQAIRGLEPLMNGGAAVAAPPPGPNNVKEWASLASLPVPTQRAFVDLLAQLKGKGRTTLTILLIGKGGVGKSSTVNSLIAERVAPVAAFQSTGATPLLVQRAAAGFTLRLIDTPSLLEGDTVSESAVERVVAALKQVGPADVVLYMDRLDCYQVEPLDKEVIQAVTDALGPTVWNNTIIGLSRAGAQPAGASYDEYCDARGGQLRRAIQAAGAPPSAALPLVLIENSSKCATDEAGQKVLPDGRPWLPLMMSEAVEVALECKPFAYDARQRKAGSPNNKRKWLVPLLLAAQVLLKVFVLDRVLEEDGITGDQYGPYDPEYVKEERARLRAEKADARAAKAAEARRKAAGRAVDASSSDDEEGYGSD